MLTNLEQEDIWVKGWNDLFEISNKHPSGYLLVNKHQEVTLEEAKAWIQEVAYKSNRVTFTIEYYKGEKSILISKDPASWQRYLTSCQSTLRCKQSSSAGRPYQAAPWQGIRHMKILSIIFILLSLMSLIGNALRIIQGESFVYNQAMVGTICLLLLTFIFTWCWRRKYRAPWILVTGTLFIILGILGMGTTYQYFDEVTEIDNIVSISITSLFFIIGISVSLWSKRLHNKRFRTTKNV